MLAITDAKGITYLMNEYDANGRMTEQATGRHRRAETVSGPCIRDESS
jgi:YD repeat-containing protein